MSAVQAEEDRAMRRLRRLLDHKEERLRIKARLERALQATRDETLTLRRTAPACFRVLIQLDIHRAAVLAVCLLHLRQN